MDKDTIIQKLNELKQKQQQVMSTWQHTGNRKLLQFFVDILPRTLNVERCSIFILDPVDSSLWLKCGTGVAEHSIKVPADNSIVGEVLKNGKTLILDSLDDRVGMHDVIGVEVGYFIKDSMCVPVHSREKRQITGVIQVMNKKGDKDRKYSSQDQDILERVAGLLQLSIENVFMKQELYKISQEIAEEISLLESQLNQKKSA